MDDLFRIIPLFFIACLLIGLVWFLKVRYVNTKWLSKLSNPKATFYFLVSWTFFGFFLNLDYNLQWGCIGRHEAIFSSQNILYTGIALAMLSAGYFYTQKTIRTIILSAELIIWLYKLFIIKDGYVIGIAGVPDISIVTFDLISLMLRILLIKQICELKFHLSYVLAIAFILLALKIQFFPNPKFIYDDIAKEPKEIERVKKQIVGHWEGLCEYYSHKDSLDYGEHDGLITAIISLDIDSNILQVKGIKDYENRKYLIHVYSPSHAQLWGVIPDSVSGDLKLMNNLGTKLNIAPDKLNSGFELWHVTQDSMIGAFDLFHRFKVKRKSN